MQIECQRYVYDRYENSGAVTMTVVVVEGRRDNYVGGNSIIGKI